MKVARTKKLNNATTPRAKVLPRALIVDDDADAAALLQLTLKKEFTLTFEESGARALQVAAESRPDFILLDLNMPNIDGFEVLKQLKQHPVCASIPVICMSAGAEGERRERAYRLGAMGFLKKPIERKSLAGDLKSLLDASNVILSAAGGQREFVIAFNPAEKYRLLRQRVDALLAEDRPTVVLSLVEGDTVCDPAWHSALAEDRLVYLQIIPSLITKFPYLQDLAPIAADLQGFLSQPGKNYTLVFDEPNALLNHHELQNAIARFQALKELLTESFGAITCFANKDFGSEKSALLNEIARLFCR